MRFLLRLLHLPRHQIIELLLIIRQLLPEQLQVHQSHEVAVICRKIAILKPLPLRRRLFPSVLRRVAKRSFVLQRLRKVHQRHRRFRMEQ